MVKVFFSIILLVVSTILQAQANNKEGSKYQFFTKKLMEYKVDSCLNGLLTAVVQLDSGYVRFPSKSFFYELTFYNEGNQGSLTILPSRWKKAAVLDYSGLIKVEDMYFLCRGNFNEDPLFKRTLNSYIVELSKPWAYQYDSIDVRIETYSWNPSLIGKYLYCEGLPIQVVVMVGRRLEGYSTKQE